MISTKLKEFKVDNMKCKYCGVITTTKINNEVVCNYCINKNRVEINKSMR